MNRAHLEKRAAESRELAQKLRKLLREYIEHSKDPEATLAIPNLEYMFQIADTICEKLQ